MANHAYELPDSNQTPAPKPNLTLVEGAPDPVDIGVGPYDVYEGQLENHYLPIVVGKADQVIGSGSATFNSTGAIAQLSEFSLSAGVDERQVFNDVVNGLLTNEHLQQLEAKLNSVEEMMAKMTVRAPSGWDKTTYENIDKGEFRIRFMRNHDAENERLLAISRHFNRPLLH